MSTRADWVGEPLQALPLLLLTLIELGQPSATVSGLTVKVLDRTQSLSREIAIGAPLCKVVIPEILQLSSKPRTKPLSQSRLALGKSYVHDALKMWVRSYPASPYCHARKGAPVKITGFITALFSASA